MNLQNGGSLDVVCSSERKKSGSTLRPHQHPGRGKAVGGHRAPSLCPSEAAKPQHPGRGKAVGGHRAPSLCPSEAAKSRLSCRAQLHLYLEIGREVSQTEL